jgi:RNA polymerase sigma factor (sigma-70 family)
MNTLPGSEFPSRPADAGLVREKTGVHGTEPAPASRGTANHHERREIHVAAGPGAASNLTRAVTTGVSPDLVMRARNGDKQAWDALVERYAPLIWSICRRHRLGRADAEDVGQNVWLQLVNHLGTVRDPAALAGWLATTTRRECGRVLYAARRSHAGEQLPEAENLSDEQARTAEQELLAAERHAALREALSCLPQSCQQLMAMLTEDPPVPYATISARLGIPVGSIGPTRRRCLDKLRRYPAIAALINAEAGTAT